VGTAADLASDPLDPDVVVIVRRAGPAPVSAPTDQRANGLALRMRTAVREGEIATGKGLCFSVLLDGIGEVLYNDHACRTPPLVVKPTSLEPQREVSFFLSWLAPLLSPHKPVSSSPMALVVPLLSFPCYPNNVAVLSLFPGFT